jgi:uncharacterized protein YndB with AHSA1/START domain
LKTDTFHTIRWKLHLRSSAARVYDMLSTGEGRKQFWAESAEAEGSDIEFLFSNGTVLRSRVIASEPDQEFRLTYFGGRIVSFLLASNHTGGTDLVLVEEDVPEAEWIDNLPGWVSVLLNLKAAVDFGVDLRNHDPNRTWEMDYVDV